MPRNLLCVTLALIFSLASVLVAGAQDFGGNDAGHTFAGPDLLFPEFAHPREDVTEAIRKKDFRFVALDRALRDVPGLAKRPDLKRTYGVKIIRQHLHLFLSASQKFSLALRARAYATEYNETLLRYLLKQRREN